MGICLSGKTLDCQPRDCEFDPPSLQLKLLKEDMYWFFPGKNATVYQCFTLGTLKNLVSHVWWVLQYLALWATNNPRRRMGKCPSASLNIRIPQPPSPNLSQSASVLKHSLKNCRHVNSRTFIID